VKAKLIKLVKPNSTTLSWSQTGSRLVADLQRIGIWPITSSELARASRSVTSLGPVCDQDSVMEFGLYGAVRENLGRYVPFWSAVTTLCRLLSSVVGFLYSS